MSTTRSASAAAVVGVATVALYASWLGWDQQKTLDPLTGTESGPYETWQVVGVVIGLGVVAFAAGRIGHRWACLLAMPVAFSACFAVDGATDADQDGLWALGALLVLLAVGLGAFVAALLGEVSHRRRPGPPTT